MRETLSPRVPAHSVRAPRRAHVLASIAVLMLLLGTNATASPPLQERGHIDDTFLAPGATRLCHFDVMVHLEGDFHFALFYDKAGNIVREVDTFPSLRVTIYAPSTGKSYTSAKPAVLLTTYRDGAVIGSTAIAAEVGLFEKIDDIALVGGRFVYEAVVTGYDEAGVPLIEFVREISSSGPQANVSAARCAAMQP
jgi:hypothetical protein